METIPYHSLLQVTQEEMLKIRQLYNLETKQIQHNVDAIDEWVKKQDHLAEGYKYMDRNMVERLNLLAKGSVEATKTKIDKLFTARTMIPELLLNKSLEEFESVMEHVIFLPLPKLNPLTLSRVMVSQFIDDNLDEFSLLNYLKFAFMIGGFRMHFDYSISDTYIIDLKHAKMNILSKLNPIILKKANIISTQVYGVKIKGIHFVNAPPFVDRLVAVLKQMLSDKVASRIHVHSSYEHLQEYFPKDILPKDYGGDATSVSKMNELWKDYLRTDEAKKKVEISNKLCSDESKRNCAKFNEEYLGMPGSFKTLSVD